MAMNEFRKDFQPMQGRFLDRAGKAARDENAYWTPIVVTKKEIDAEVERLASLPQPANGRRESLIVHPLAAADAPGFAPGIQVKLSVLKPGEKTAAFRHNATEVNFCIGGSGRTLVAGRRVAFAQYDVWNHPSYAINPHTVESKPLHFPWKEVKRELDKLEALGKDYVGRRLYMMYNPVTGRTNGVTPNFFATITIRP